MLETLFSGIFDSATQSTISVTQFLLCVGVSLLIGIFLALTYTYRCRGSKSFIVTLAIIPAIVCVIIMLVNGNIGAGVAVAGAFSLVRFRSAPGTAREIGALFLAMGTGLIAGMGYLGYAVLFALVLGLVTMLYYRLKLGESSKAAKERILRITIPESLDYTDVFDDVFEAYTSEHKVRQVKTTNMGSMFKLTYDITLKNIEDEKKLLDDIRVRNGNLEVSLSLEEENSYEL